MARADETSGTRARIGAAAAGLALLLAAGAAQAGVVELITNGDFETGDFTGWSTAKTPGSAGDFLIVPISPTGTPSPVNAFPVPGNPAGGSFAAMSEQTGPNAVALTQVFTVPLATVKLELSFSNFIDDYSGASPVGPAFPGIPGQLGPGLDETPTSSTQFVLFDILTAGADALMPLPGDVVTSITNPFPAPAFAAGSNPWLPSGVFDLTGALAPGGTYQLRFGEVDNSGNLLAGLDNVSLVATTAPVPLPPALPLLAAGVVGLGLLRRNRRG
jgi:hypothetical protein